MAAKLIIVHGLPATGKTTLAKKISQDLGLPYAGKSAIKEFLFDELGSRDREWSAVLGGLATDMLYMAAETVLSRQEPIIAESAFYTTIARPKMRKIIAQTSATCLEVYCTAQPFMLQERFASRNQNPHHTPIHIDTEDYRTGLDELAVRHAPLSLQGSQELIVDTTDFHEADYQKLLADIAVFIEA